MAVEMTVEMELALRVNMLVTQLQLQIPSLLGIEVDRTGVLRDQLPLHGQIVFDALTAIVEPDDEA